MKAKSIVTGIFALTLGCLGGCAFTTDKVAIQYLPQVGVSTLEKAKSVVVSVQVNDSRPDKSKVGSKKNGYGMELASIEATEDVSLTFRQAIEYELKARGFSLGQEALVAINADLTKYENDFKMGLFSGDAVAELNMGVTVKSKKGDLIFARSFVTKGLEPGIQIASGENARIALEKALSQGLKNMFEDQSFISALLATAKI